ncbi:cytochrome P450 family protein [Ceratobasidium sp. AG-Ba]|nr:cytochrome P450 family protein [Ceratobasidium sp. AG-Ba]
MDFERDFLPLVKKIGFESGDSNLNLRQTTPGLLVILATLFILYSYLISNRSTLLLPPSPPKHWISGNASQRNPPYRHVVFGTEYKDKYGSIISLTTRTETQIIINTPELANELLEKQTAYTSGRAHNVMVYDIMNWGTSVAYQPHDERHKKSRRVIASAFHPAAAKSYAMQHRDSALDLIRLINEQPDDFEKHVKEISGAFVMRLVYGHIVTKDDPMLKTVREAISYLGKGSRFFWVNQFPILKYVPAWVPGAGFQVLGREGRILRNRMVDESFGAVYDQVRRGRVEQPSYTSRLLEDKGGVNVNEEDENLIKWTAGSMFAAGSTTTVDIIMAFFLQMALHPEVAKVAQGEIDAVVGRERLPELSDREKLPYFEATLLEVIRLWPPIPLGAGHLTSKELEFEGYRIPKGANVFANIWAILRDSSYYPSPHTFDPTRFLKSTPDPDPRKYVFGFGKRVCPGIHVANNSTFVMTAGLLSVFDISATPELMAKVETLGGRDSMEMYKMSSPSGPLIDILPFSAKFKLRDPAAVILVSDH